MSAVDLLVGAVVFAAAAGMARVLDVSVTRQRRWLILVIVAAGMAAALATPSSATGAGAADAVWRMAVVGLVALAAARARPWAVVVAAAAVAAMAAPGSAWLGFAAIGLVVASGSPVAAAAAGALVGNGILRLDWPPGRGASAAVAVAVIAVVVATTDAAFVRRIAIGGAVLAVGCAAAFGLATVSLAGERGAASQAVDAGNQALDAARRGDAGTSRREFQRAADLLDEVHGRLRAWTVRPALAIPVVGANLREALDVVDIARTIATTGVATARAADVDRIAPLDGAVDLVALRAFASPLADLEATLGRSRRRLASARSTWTIPALTRRSDELLRRTTSALGDTVRARRAVATVPRLLGGDGARRYFLAVMTPSELRGGGGFVGNWGILSAADGRLTLPRFGRIRELYRPVPYRITVSPEYDDRYVRGWMLGTYPQNILASPDLPSNAAAIAQILQQAGEGPVDGIVVVDPIAMAALLELTGPIDVDGWDAPLDSTNVAETLLYRQYEHAQDPRRPELLARTTRALFDRLTTGALPAVASMAKALGPVVAGGHLQFASLHDVDHRLLADIGLEHALEPPATDALAVISQNAAPSKLDWFLRRSITYELKVDHDGRAKGTVSVQLRNTAPSTGLPKVDFQYEAGGLGLGVDVQAVSLYTPLVVGKVTLDGTDVEFGTATERGYKIYDRFVTLGPGATSTVRFHVEGRLAIRDGRYRLDLQHQPTAVPDVAHVKVNGRTLFDGTLDRDLHLTTAVH